MQNVKNSFVIVTANDSVSFVKNMSDETSLWMYKTWHFGQVHGPVTLNYIQQSYENGTLDNSSLCWRYEKYVPKRVYIVCNILKEYV